MNRERVSNVLLSTFLVAGIATMAIPGHAGSMGNGYPRKFTSESSAQQHCPKDTVVWGNSDRSKTFYMKGSPSYAKTNGFYACMAEAKQKGMHPAT
jgi:hypothetical protein